MERLTEAQRDLIWCLNALGLDQDAIIMIMLLVRTDEQIAEMADFIAQHPNATESDLLEEAAQIKETT